MLGDTLTLPVTKEHLERAVEATKGSLDAIDYGKQCLVAQAAKEVLGDDFRRVGVRHITTLSKRAYRMDEIGYNLVLLFDKWTDDGSSIESALPAEVTISEVPMQEYVNGT